MQYGGAIVNGHVSPSIKRCSPIYVSSYALDETQNRTPSPTPPLVRLTVRYGHYHSNVLMGLKFSI